MQLFLDVRTAHPIEGISKLNDSIERAVKTTNGQVTDLEFRHLGSKTQDIPRIEFDIVLKNGEICDDSAIRALECSIAAHTKIEVVSGKIFVPNPAFSRVAA